MAQQVRPRVPAQTVYAVRADLATVGMGARAISQVPDATADDALSKASALADSFLARRYTLPLKQWGDDLVLAVAQIAAFYAMKGVGFNPDAAHDQLLVKGNDDAIQWLKWIGDGLAVLAPPVEDSSDPQAAGGWMQRVVW